MEPFSEYEIGLALQPYKEMARWSGEYGAWFKGLERTVRSTRYDETAFSQDSVMVIGQGLNVEIQTPQGAILQNLIDGYIGRNPMPALNSMAFVPKNWYDACQGELEMRTQQFATLQDDYDELQCETQELRTELRVAEDGLHHYQNANARGTLKNNLLTGAIGLYLVYRVVKEFGRRKRQKTRQLMTITSRD